MFDGQTCLVTGGTGSWGHELTRKLLLQNPKEIRIFSRNEYAQVEMQREFGPLAPLSFVIGDVRDFAALQSAAAGVDYIFHLAALKHVPICERQPEEALKTNVMGTQNVIRAAIEAGVKKVVDVSTDKAVNPLNFYGITKAMGEKLMLQANSLSTKTRFVCIRGGNVLGTNGSVVPLFKRQIVNTGSITLTDARMTRFFLTVSEAINLLLIAANASIGGETFVMKMRTCNIRDLALAMGKQLSDKPINIQEIGIRPGEKLHEVLISQYEAPNTRKYSDDCYVILPHTGAQALYQTYGSYDPVYFTEYNSSCELMDEAAILHMLRNGGFLP